MRRGRFIAAACAVGVLLVGAAVLAGSPPAVPMGEMPPGPLVAVVSYSPPEVLVVDAVAWRVAGRVPLRSMGTDPVALPGRRALALAQCGGPGADADNALAIVDLSESARVRYLTLDCPNPGSVDLLPDGTLAVGHGWEDDGGWVFSHVDATQGVTLGEWRIPNASTPPAVAGGFLWTWGAEEDERGALRAVLRRTEPGTGGSEVVADLSENECFIQPEAPGAATVLRVWSRDGGAVVERLDARSLVVQASRTITGVKERIVAGVTTPGHVVLLDGGALDPERPGGPMLVLGRDSLALERRIDVSGLVTAVAALGETLYAVTLDGELLEVDLATGSLRRRLDLEGTAGKVLQAVALP